MKQSYSKFYEKPSAFASIRFSLDALMAPNNARRVSLLNRQKDYTSAIRDEKTLQFHRRVNKHLFEQERSWQEHDYGEGYLYQGLKCVGLTGLRDTDGRVDVMGLLDLLKGVNVLEIGCNTGFISARVASSAANVTGFDINPYLIDVGNEVLAELEINNVRLFASAFEATSFQDRFGAVLSFANHTTFDGNTKQSVESYFRRCYDLIEDGGLFLFESHTPSYEGDRLQPVLTLIAELFRVEQSGVLDYGTFLDKGRTFVIARKVRSA